MEFIAGFAAGAGAAYRIGKPIVKGVKFIAEKKAEEKAEKKAKKKAKKNASSSSSSSSNTPESSRNTSSFEASSSKSSKKISGTPVLFGTTWAIVPNNFQKKK